MALAPTGHREDPQESRPPALEQSCFQGLSRVEAISVLFPVRKLETPKMANSSREGIHLHLRCLLISPPGRRHLWPGLKHLKVASIIFPHPLSGFALCALLEY